MENISTVVLIMLVAGMARIKKLDLDQTIRFVPRRIMAFGILATEVPQCRGAS